VGGIAAGNGIAEYIFWAVYARDFGVISLTLHPGEGNIEVVNINYHVTEAFCVIDGCDGSAAIIAGVGVVGIPGML